jgi:putative sigma-54 modulation protein
MALDEAALQLEGAPNDFVVFRDIRTDRVCVLYKRKDDNYGLISPA